MNAPWGDARADRYWSERGATVHVDEDGLLVEPAERWGFASNPGALGSESLCTPRCTVILGEPGSGKSETLRSRAPLLPDAPRWAGVPIVVIDLAEYGTEDRLAEALFNDERIVRWRAEGSGELCVVLDSLDECKERVGHIATVLGREIERWPTDRLYLRICCRTVDWPESLQAALSDSFGEVSVFELLPLTRTAVRALAAEAGVSGDEFLLAVSAARVGPLAAKPLTLELLLRLYARDGCLPSDAVALYRDALLLLMEEPALHRREAQPIGRMAAPDRFAIACRLAALSIFSQSDAFWTGLPDTRLVSDLALRDCAGGNEPGPAGPVPATEGAIRETLRTGLFTSRGASRVGWAHQTFAEYLAARYLLDHELSERQATNLLVAPDAQVYPQLRPVAAWLLALAPRGDYDSLVEQDPELLLAATIDVSRMELRARAVDGLFQLAGTGQHLDRFGLRLDGLANPDLEMVARRYLQDGSFEQRLLAVDVVRDCRIIALRSELLKMVLDDAESYRLRTAAAYALEEIAEVVPVTELRNLAAAPSGERDPDDELKGFALRISWPSVMTTAEVLEALTPPRRSNLIGAYSMFVEHELPQGLTVSDVDAGLDWLLAAERAAQRHDRFDSLADRVIALALDCFDIPEVIDRVAEVALLRAAKHEPLFVERAFGENPRRELSTSQRRELVSAVLARVDVDDVIWLADHSAYGPALVVSDDLEWLIERYEADPALTPVLDRLIGWVFNPRVDGHAKLVLALPPDHALRSGAFEYWLTTVELDSDLAKRHREQHRLVRGRDESDQPQAPSDAEVEARICGLLERFDHGELDGYWQACALVYLPPGERFMRGEFASDLAAQPRWDALSEGTQGRLVDAAHRYLVTGSCAPEEWLAQGHYYRPAQAGYRALQLLRHVEESSLEVLPDSAWREWAPAILDGYDDSRAAAWDERASLLDMAATRAEDAVFAAAVAIIERGSARSEPIFRERELVHVWSPRLSSWCREAIAVGQLHATTAADVERLLLQQDPDIGRPLLEGVLRGDSDVQRRIDAGALLLTFEAQSSWATVYSVLQQEPDLGDSIVLKTASEHLHRDGPPELSPPDLADLYVWLADRFPHGEDPVFDEAHFVGPREQLSHWRDGILRSLERRGSPASVAAIARIQEALPDRPWLRVVRRSAERNLRRNTWQAIRPKDLIDLVAFDGRRLVASAADLLDVVAEALSTIQNRLTGETPEAALLWDTRSGRPKPEDEISDYLRNRLHDLLVSRHVVVNREVQVRSSGRGMGERTDLRVDAVQGEGDSATTLTMVIEVKGAWNRGLMNDLSGQLVGRYMRDVGTSHGIYLVAWPDLESWESADLDRRTVERRIESGDRQRLDEQAAELADEGLDVRVVHLSVAMARQMPPT